MRCSIKKRYAEGLPGAPVPTKPKYVNSVQGICHHLEVRPTRPPVIVEDRKARKKRRTPQEAIAESARRKSEAKRQRKAEAIRLWESGMSIKEIAEHMGLKCGAICDYTREVRGPLVRAERHKYDDDIIRMYGAGKTYDEMADALGITRSLVNSVVVRLQNAGKLGRRKIRIK